MMFGVVTAVALLFCCSQGACLLCHKCQSFQHLSDNTCFDVTLAENTSVQCQNGEEFCYQVLQRFEGEDKTVVKFSRGCSFIKKDGKFIIPHELTVFTHKVVANTCCKDNCNDLLQDELEQIGNKTKNGSGSKLVGEMRTFTIFAVIALFWSNFIET